jgi:hypothetical protein
MMLATIVRLAEDLGGSDAPLGCDVHDRAGTAAEIRHVIVHKQGICSIRITVTTCWLH